MGSPIKSAAVYRHDGHYFVHANSVTDAGFWIASLPAARLPDDATLDTLGSAVTDILAASGSTVPAPARDDYGAVHRPLLKAAGVRSWAALQRSAALCNIWQTEDAISLEPTQNGGSSGKERGYRPLADRRIVVNACHSPGELGQAVLAALDRCT